jgi:putative sugar O-methyltransferase
VDINKIKNNYESQIKLVSNTNYSNQHWKILMKNKSNLFSIDFFENFRANEISFGLDNSNVRGEEKLNYSENTKLLFSKYKGTIHSNILECVNEHPCGNPLVVKQDGNVFSKSSIELCLIATHLYDVLKDVRYIVEIGGGYGGLSRIIKTLFPKITIILIDLPEANAISSFYLSRIFPEAHIEFDASNLMKNKIDFLIISPNEINSIRNLSIDLIINTRSMMEMNYRTIFFYFKHIERIIKSDGYLYLLNRFQKISSFKHYPLGLNWEIKLSEMWPKDIDSNLHAELLLKKTNKANIDLKHLLSSFPPKVWLNMRQFVKSQLVYRSLLKSWRGNIA